MVPPVPAIGVGAVVFDEQRRVLLIRRGARPALGQWSVPGGKLEPGETLAQACRREVLEETALSIEPRSVIAVVERIIEDFHYIIIDFLATPRQPGSPVLRAAADVSEARWVALSALEHYDLVEGLQRVIARAAIAQGLRDADGDGRDFIASEP
jgi:8-oxo-dGTP diphosphatase